MYRDGAPVARTKSTSYTDTGLTDGEAYSYYVVAYNQSGASSSPSNTVSATPVASSTSWDPSGEAMPVGNLPGWNQVFADNFAGDNVPVGSFSGCSWPNGANLMTINCTGLAPYPGVEAKWFAYPDGWKDTTGAGTYYPSKVISIQNGVMNLYLHTETVNGTSYHMVSAPVPKIPGGSGSLGGMLYGRYAIRFRADSLHGYKTAWLLWPDSNTWPADGEMDFPEGDLDSTINAYLHWMNGTSGNSQDAFPTTVTYNSWHTAVLTWTPLGTTFTLDGSVVGTDTNLSLIPSTPMHWVIQTETSTDGTGPPADATGGNVQIDWVTAYSQAS